MPKEMDLKSAKMIFEQLCNAMEARKWKYEKHEDKFLIRFEVRGEDIPMDFAFYVDAERQLVRIKSRLTFNFAENKRVEGAIVTNHINFKLADGCFEYDITDGETNFRLTTSCRDSLLSDATIDYMLRCALFVVEEYNDKLLAVSKGYMTVEQFIANN